MTSEDWKLKTCTIGNFSELKFKDMCEITQRLNDNEIPEKTGYKVAIKLEDKYFSPATGVEYKVGLVEVGDRFKHFIKHQIYRSDILIPSSSAYKEEYVGQTAVFDDLARATALKIKFAEYNEYYAPSLVQHIVILKMTLSNIKFKGTYNDSSVWMGSVIKEIEEL